MALHQLRGDQRHPRLAHEGPQCLVFVEPAALTRVFLPLSPDPDLRRSPEVDLARAATPRLLGLIWYFLSRQVISQIFLPVRLRDGFTT